jgi:hypothetical protein
MNDKCSAQVNFSDLLQTFNSLPQDQQNQLLDQIAGDISGTGTGTGTGTTTGTGTGTTTTTGTNQGGLPLGQDAIAFVLANSPSNQVNAARNGTPTFQGEMFEQPVDEPDFWDRVKEVFIDGLIQAFTQSFGFDLSGLTGF